MASILAIAASNIDVVIIQYFWGSVNVAYFYAAQRIWALLLSLGTAVGTVLFPYISKKYAIDKIAEVKKLSKLAERYIALLIVPIVVFIISFTTSIVHVLISDNMFPAIFVIRIMAISALLFSLDTPYYQLFLGIDKPRLAARIHMSRCIINILLSIVLVSPAIFGIRLPGLGAFGSALASVISILVITFVDRYYAWKFVGIIVDPVLVRYMMAALITAILFFFIDTSWATRWYSLSALALFFSGTYAAILYMIGGLKRQDINLILKTLNPVGMVKYILNEIRDRDEED